MNIAIGTSPLSAERSKRKLRLIYAHDGISKYDYLFLNLFVRKFETYLVTFVPPSQAAAGTHIVRLRDFGKSTLSARINRLRIVLGTFWRIIQLKQCLDYMRPDIVLASWVTTYGLYVWICRWRPFILFAYGSDVLLDPRRSPLHRIIISRVIRSAQFLLIDSNVQRRAVLSLGCSPERIICLPWVDLGDMRDIRSDCSLRRGLGWEDKSIIVSVRLHEPNYSIDTLIQAVPKIVTECENARFLIFGDGSQTEELISLARKLNLNDYVYFGGMLPRKELLGYMKDSDVYVSTSLSDGTSSSLVEAMFFELPVVVTSIPGNIEWVRDGSNGLMFRVQDQDELARKVTWLLANPEEGKRMGRNAAVFVRKTVDWETASDQLVNKMYEARSTPEGLGRD
jgi:glycosyltransferase involved in cell wall biosynthesis